MDDRMVVRVRVLERSPGAFWAEILVDGVVWFEKDHTTLAAAVDTIEAWSLEVERLTFALGGHTRPIH